VSRDDALWIVSKLLTVDPRAFPTFCAHRLLGFAVGARAKLRALVRCSCVLATGCSLQAGVPFAGYRTLRPASRRTSMRASN
jgi:hypothetical protein